MIYLIKMYAIKDIKNIYITLHFFLINKALISIYL